jgi:hypothetical protein
MCEQNVKRRCYTLGIEDIASSALIWCMKQYSVRFLTYTAIEKFGNAVIEILQEQGTPAQLILYRNKTDEFLYRCSGYFREKEIDGQLGLEVPETITAVDLELKFRGFLPVDVLMATVDSKALRVLHEETLSEN